MVCPSCGNDISDDAKQCAQCGYKFSYWYGFNDPGKMRLLNFISGAKSKKSVIARLLIYAVLILIFILVFFSWLQSLIH